MASSHFSASRWNESSAQFTRTRMVRVVEQNRTTVQMHTHLFSTFTLLLYSTYMWAMPGGGPGMSLLQWVPHHGTEGSAKTASKVTSRYTVPIVVNHQFTFFTFFSFPFRSWENEACISRNLRETSEIPVWNEELQINSTKMWQYEELQRNSTKMLYHLSSGKSSN